MPLSCDCDNDGDYDWFYIVPRDYSTLATKRRKRCSSCKKLIDIGAVIAEFDCYRPPKDDVEDRIYGEDGEIPIASKYLCEPCADLWYSFRELGFDCIDPTENMNNLARQYAELRSSNE